MKFLPIVVSFLSAAALIGARPVDTPVDPLTGALNLLLAFLQSLTPPTTPPTTPTDPPRPAGRCTVIRDVTSKQCPGGPSCLDGPKYKVDDQIDFTCHLPGYDADKTDGIPPQDWVKVPKPTFGYLPRDSLDKDCDVNRMPECPEAKF